MDDILAPKILKVRAERILKKRVKAAYRTDDPNVIRCVLESGGEAMVNLIEKDAVEAPRKPAKIAPQVTPMITREDVVQDPREQDAPEPKRKKKNEQGNG